MMRCVPFATIGGPVVRRGLYLLTLALALVALADPGHASAAADCGTTANLPSGAVPEQTFSGLKAAVAAIASGAERTFYLEAPVTAPAGEGLALPAGATVTLDLDGCDLTIAEPAEDVTAVAVPPGAVLKVEDTSSEVVTEQGSLEATGGTDHSPGAGTAHAGAGIGGGGTVSISGGNVTATGGACTYFGGAAAGIGGVGGAASGGSEDGGPSGAVSISGGNVTATGGEGADFGGGGAGIGGGGGDRVGGDGTVSISGGIVTAKGGEATNAAGAGAGIGGGGGGTERSGGDGTVSISGGDVIAVGAAVTFGGGAGAGIGGGGGGSLGFGGPGGTVSISGGTVSATGGAGARRAGGSGAGIGGGGGGDGFGFEEPAIGGAGGAVTISGGSITATGGPASFGVLAAPGIGPGDGSGAPLGSVTVEQSAGESPSLAAEVAAQLSVQPEADLSIPAAGSLVLDDASDLNEGTIFVAGTLAGAGALDNQGAIAVSGSAWSVAGYEGPGDFPSGLMIAGNAFELSFSVPSGTAPDGIWVFAPSVVEGGESLPQATPPAGGSFDGWFTEASGGAQVTDSSALTVDLALSAHFSGVPQAINFPPIGTHTLGEPDLDPGATASSSLGVAYTSQTESVCTIIAGKIHLV